MAPEAGYLLDVDLLIALTEEQHVHHQTVTAWFHVTGKRNWGVSAFTEAGFLRFMTNPKFGALSLVKATEILRCLAAHPGYRYWPISDSWTTLVAPFSGRLFGHQQVTDACLLGLAIRQNGILATMDKALKFVAGDEYRQHLLVLE